METRIVISQLLNQTQVGLVEDGRLAEYYIQRDDEQRAVGNIYKGRVENVLPGMNAAFVELGSGRNGFCTLMTCLGLVLANPSVRPCARGSLSWSRYKRNR